MSYLDDMNLQVFAEISSAFPPHADMQNATLDKTLFDYLLIAIAEAKTFIHFSTWNIDETILEALVKASRKVKVQGIVGKPDYAKAYGRIQGLQHQKVSQGYNIDFRIQNEVHSKFIIFDGLICFVGSANLTKFAWEKANNFDQRTGKAVLKEIIQVISKPYDVIEFNNIYFSPNWILESSDFDDLF